MLWQYQRCHRVLRCRHQPSPRCVLKKAPGLGRLLRLICVAKRKIPPKPKIIPDTFTRADSIELTLKLQKCSRWNSVASLYYEHESHMNSINVAAVMTQLWKVLPRRKGKRALLDRREEAKIQDLFTRLVYTASRCVPEMGVRELCTVARCCAALGIKHEWLAIDLQDYSLELMAQQPGAFDARHLAQLTYSFAGMAYTPSSDWCGAVLALFRGQWQKAESQALANMLYGLARLGISPGVDWLSGYLQISMSALPDCSHAELHQIISALGILRTGKFLGQQAVFEDGDIGDDNEGGNATVMFASLASAIQADTPQWQLPDWWAQAFCHAVADQLGDFTVQNAVAMLMNLALLKCDPGRDLTQQLTRRACYNLQLLGAERLPRLLAALGTLQHPLPPDLQQVLLNRLQQQWPALRPAAVVPSLHALASLGWQVDAEFAQRILLRCNKRTLTRLPTAAMLMLVGDLGAVGVGWQQELLWLQELWSAFKERLPLEKPLLPSALPAWLRLMQVLLKDGSRPPSDWWTTFFFVASSSKATDLLQQSDPNLLVELLEAVEAAQGKPPNAWLTQMEALLLKRKARGQYWLVNQEARHRVVIALTKLGHAPNTAAPTAATAATRGTPKSHKQQQGSSKGQEAEQRPKARWWQRVQHRTVVVRSAGVAAV